jgi:hypothetical protein
MFGGLVNGLAKKKKKRFLAGEGEKSHILGHLSPFIVSK